MIARLTQFSVSDTPTLKPGEPPVEFMNRRGRPTLLVVALGLVVNILLAALKTGIGILGHSPALLADGINSVSDVAYYLVVTVFIRLARKPADDEHPYGHSQLESIASVVIGAFVITTAIAVFWDAVNTVYDLWIGNGSFQGAALAAMVVAFATILIKFVLLIITRRTGEATKSHVLLALAYDHRNDIFTASAASIGIALGRMGFPWVDPLAGALVAIFILRTGIKILKDSASELMDTLPGAELEREIKQVMYAVSGVQQVEEIRMHRFGPYLVANVTIGMDGRLSVAEGDSIATRVEEALLERIENMHRVHVHYHPA